MMEAKNRKYWLWVTRPETYFDENGSEADFLDPSLQEDVEGWWTCHKETQKGDLVLLWRTSPKKDIGYLIQAASDAYSITDDEYANQHGWDYGCEYKVLYKFKNPITIIDIHNDPYFHDWTAYRAKFQRRVFKIDFEYWIRLNNLASQKNRGYKKFLEEIEKDFISKKILFEEELEEKLISNLKILKKFGYDLELYIDPITGETGRQFVCKGNGGRIDLLCFDKNRKSFVVIELKNVKANQNTFGQICNYIGWVQERIAGKFPVMGIVISRGSDNKFASALKITDKIKHLDLKEIGLEQ